MNTRQQDILMLTERHGEITIKDLAQKLGVSEMTIHRDLDALQEAKLIYKKRGAAVFVDLPDRGSISFYAEEKTLIGKRAAELIEDGQSVIFDNSTTALECARYLDPVKRLTCYTTNLEIAQVLSKNNDHILYCSGGYYFQDSKGFVGQHAERFVASIRADVCIVGASGISVQNGITNPYPMHNSLQQKIIGASRRCILVADHSKFDRVAIEKTAELSVIDTLVTDGGVDEKTLNEYRKHIRRIIVAKKGEGV